MAKAKSQKKKLVQINSNQQALLRKLPGVDHLMELTAKEVFFKNIPTAVVVNSIRSVIDSKRQAILSDDPSFNNQSLSDPHLMDAVKHAVKNAMTPNLRNTINATGVVVHTNLGRSLLATEVVENLITIASRYSWLSITMPEQFCCAWKPLPETKKLLFQGVSLSKSVVPSGSRM
jgi:L-seryl-tRNA(Ser) seleniumtransferase